ncbi:MAG: 50S ribosomal protein L32 [Gammaproteobacteria bacterium]|nr:50S ribosomal protein L32 [Gammaproteobacteria bacterium]
MAVQKNRKTRSKRDKRRTHQKIKKPAVSMDPLTGDIHLRHHVSPDGIYRGEQVVGVEPELDDD